MICMRLNFMERLKVAYSRLLFQLKMHGLLRVIDGSIVKENETQLDVRAFELRRERVERIRGANRGDGGGIQRIFAGSSVQAKASPGKLPSRLMRKVIGDDSFVSHVSRFGHHGVPILFYLGEQTIDVTIEIHALRGREDCDAHCRLALPRPCRHVHRRRHLRRTPPPSEL